MRPRGSLTCRTATRSRAAPAGLRARAKEHGVRIHEQVRDGRVVGYYYPKEARDGYAAYLTGRQQ
jgi:hypothetical protein